MTQPYASPQGPGPLPADLVMRYVASGEPPDGPLGTALFHHRAQPEIRKALVPLLAVESEPQARAAALAWIGRYQARRSLQGRQFLRVGLHDPAAEVRQAALRHVGEVLSGAADALAIIEREVLPHTNPAIEPLWRLRLLAWHAVGAALREDPFPRFSAQGGDPDDRVSRGVRLLSQMRVAQATGDANSAGMLAGHWEQALAQPD